jgi:hypothetical protein
MRHFLPGAVGTLARSVGETTASRLLVAPPGGTHGASSGSRCPVRTTVAIAAITRRTDHPQLLATNTGKQTSDHFHRQIPADALDLPHRWQGY